MFKFMLGTNGVNEELERHRGKMMTGSVSYAGKNVRV